MFFVKLNEIINFKAKVKLIYFKLLFCKLQIRYLIVDYFIKDLTSLLSLNFNFKLISSKNNC